MAGLLSLVGSGYVSQRRPWISLAWVTCQSQLDQFAGSAVWLGWLELQAYACSSHQGLLHLKACYGKKWERIWGGQKHRLPRELQPELGPSGPLGASCGAWGPAPFPCPDDRWNSRHGALIGKAPAEGNGNTRQYSCLENPMDRGAWRATVHRVTKSQTQRSDWTKQQRQTVLSLLLRCSPSSWSALPPPEVLALLLRCSPCSWGALPAPEVFTLLLRCSPCSWGARPPPEVLVRCSHSAAVRLFYARPSGNGRPDTPLRPHHRFSPGWMSPSNPFNLTSCKWVLPGNLVWPWHVCTCFAGALNSGLFFTSFDLRGWPSPVWDFSFS